MDMEKEVILFSCEHTRSISWLHWTFGIDRFLGIHRLGIDAGISIEESHIYENSIGGISCFHEGIGT